MFNIKLVPSLDLRGCALLYHMQICPKAEGVKIIEVSYTLNAFVFFAILLDLVDTKL